MSLSSTCALISGGLSCLPSISTRAAPTFGAGARTNFGLTNGQVYEVAVFQAERQTTGSTYRLTLSGFNAAPSQCTPTCGDGIKPESIELIDYQAFCNVHA